MVDLSGNTAGGPIEHGFSNYVFIVSGVLVVTVVVELIQKVPTWTNQPLGFIAGRLALHYCIAFRIQDILPRLEQMDDIDIEELAKMAQASGGDSAEEMDAEQLASAQEKLKLLMNNYRSAQQGISIHFSVYLVAFVVIFGTVGFFAYKLVQSLKNKERKREEKRKLKELKKKK